jgi:uncharacterized protein (TIGR03435 family)
MVVVRTACCTVLAAALSMSSFAQTEPAAVQFEAVSVRRNTSGARGGAFDTRPGRFRTTNIPLSVIAVQAYGIRDEARIVGAPDWLATTRFDIAAVEPAGTFSPEQRSGMIRAMLRDRFKLAARMETRELPIYRLVVARTDGQLGPNLQPNKDPTQRRQSNSVDPTGGTIITAGAITMARLTGMMNGFVTRPVADATGLAGEFDLTLRFLPEPGARAVPAGPSANQTTTAPDVPSIFTAVQEQLGLRLEATRGPVEVLVIDHIEPPTEN